MPQLSGMTGFAREVGHAVWGNWVWEAKSVNGRTLDVRVNYPPGFDAIERSVKSLVQGRFERGSLQISLRIDVAAGNAISINEELLAALTASLAKATGQPASSEAVAQLMTLKGVVETGGANGRDLAADPVIIKELESGAERALAALHQARLAEGASLKTLFAHLAAEMEALRQRAKSLAETQPLLLKEKLDKQLNELGARDRVDQDRLAAEVALSVARADVREELDRLGVHFNSLGELLAAGSPAGRKLDFLAQELNREANTLCSKSASLELTQAGLALKGVIDQFKEQAANVE